MSLRLAFTTGIVGISYILASVKTAMGSYTEDLKHIERVAEESWHLKEFNCILANTGRLYVSNADEAVERVFEREGNMTEIDTLWMKRAPKSLGCKLLKQLFSKKKLKPTIHIGLAYNYSASDRQGLKDLIRDGIQLEVWDNISTRVRPCEYKRCFQQYLKLLNEEVSDGEPSAYTEDKVAIISRGEDNTNHILTNEGTLYRSIEPCAIECSGASATGSSLSVVEVLANTRSDVKTIHTLWIKKAPRLSDVQLLLEMFKEQSSKPIIYIGHIHKYTGEDRQGLKDLIKGGFELKVWERASLCVKPKYNECLQKYLQLLYEEISTHPDKEPTSYSENNVAIISCGEDRVTHLLTNEGKMYRNSYELDQHAEIVLSKSGDNPSDITEIWIKNSPCSQCTEVLRKFFADCATKPVIYIGSLYHDVDLNTSLSSLIKDGFKVKVWQTMSTYKYRPGDDHIEKYLSSLQQKEEVEYYSSSSSTEQHCSIEEQQCDRLHA